MAKKKDKDEEGKRSRKKPKFRLPLGQIILVLPIIAGIYGVSNPEELGGGAATNAAKSIQTKVMGLMQPEKLQVAKMAGALLGNSQQAQDIAGMVLGQEDIDTAELSKLIKQRVGELSDEQIKKLKTEFCADVIEYLPED